MNYIDQLNSRIESTRVTINDTKAYCEEVSSRVRTILPPVDTTLESPAKKVKNEDHSWTSFESVEVETTTFEKNESNPQQPKTEEVRTFTTIICDCGCTEEFTENTTQYYEMLSYRHPDATKEMNRKGIPKEYHKRYIFEVCRKIQLLDDLMLNWEEESRDGPIWTEERQVKFLKDWEDDFINRIKESQQFTQEEVNDHA